MPKKMPKKTGILCETIDFLQAVVQYQKMTQTGVAPQCFRRHTVVRQAPGKSTKHGWQESLFSDTASLRRKLHLVTYSLRSTIYVLVMMEASTSPLAINYRRERTALASGSTVEAVGPDGER